MTLLSNYDIANYLGHTALHHLYGAYRIYTVPISIALAENGIKGFWIDFKEKSDIYYEMSTKKIADINIATSDPINAFHFAGQLEQLQKKEAEHCIDTAIYFQAMMEAVINDIFFSEDYKKFFKKNLRKKKDNESFYDKWINFLRSNDASNQEILHFNNYKKNIYDTIRIPAIHAKGRNGLMNIEALNFAFVHENIKHGWFSFVFLLNKIHNFSMDYEENWKTMSQEAHQIPNKINIEEFPNYGNLVKDLYKKHLDYFNRHNSR